MSYFIDQNNSQVVLLIVLCYRFLGNLICDTEVAHETLSPTTCHGRRMTG
jgi:hypothetical protein